MEPMLEMYLFETTQSIQQLEMLILETERYKSYSERAVNEIFRIMHTIKGSSSMMLYQNICDLAHSMEDLFFFLREQKPERMDASALSDLLLEGVDIIRVELQKIKDGFNPDGNTTFVIEAIHAYLAILKEENDIELLPQTPESQEKPQFYIASDPLVKRHKLNNYQATLFLEEDCGMEHIRAYTIVHNLKDRGRTVQYTPEDILENEDCVYQIREEGFRIWIQTDQTYEELLAFFKEFSFLRDLELILVEDQESPSLEQAAVQDTVKENLAKATYIDVEKAGLGSRTPEPAEPQTKSIISVQVAKLDRLMDLVGEMVIAEAMVTQNPDLKGLRLYNFQKAARQLHKISSEFQSVVMSIRMVPLFDTFQKMHRIVRDMCKKLSKEVTLTLIGEETEVDKNIIEHISDPIMHLVRNAIDHGIEPSKLREELGKPRTGTLILEAKNAGSDVLIIVKDDGRGLNREKILQRARENKLLSKPEQELSEKEIYSLIFLPGFSTKEAVSEYSGRGVGMDVVQKNLSAVGGSISVDSVEGHGSTITLKIPLTLAIIDGMNVKVGRSCYTIPTTAILESFRPKEGDLIQDPDGNEMIMVRGDCYPVLRLHRFFHVQTANSELTKGILIMVELDGKRLCLFADELVGQQQVVVKALPDYIKNARKIGGLAGCTLLGDGSISLIIDIGKLNSR
jgi:two-component system chemotaxis sensor kinase CheA